MGSNYYLNYYLGNFKLLNDNVYIVYTNNNANNKALKSHGLRINVNFEKNILLINLRDIFIAIGLNKVYGDYNSRNWLKEKYKDDIDKKYCKITTKSIIGNGAIRYYDMNYVTEDALYYILERSKKKGIKENTEIIKSLIDEFRYEMFVRNVI